MVNDIVNLLTYNKYLLENKDDLKLVIRARLINFLRTAFYKGKKSIILYDISHLKLPLFIKHGVN
jgi:hypothetical protein